MATSDLDMDEFAVNKKLSKKRASSSTESSPTKGGLKAVVLPDLTPLSGTPLPGAMKAEGKEEEIAAPIAVETAAEAPPAEAVVAVDASV